MKITSKKLLIFIQNKISSNDYEELELWISSIGRRFGIFKPKFHMDIINYGYKIEYISTGAYLGEGYYETKYYIKVGDK